MLRVASLCSGVGGLDLATRLALEHLGRSSRTVLYVEREAYAAGILVARMEEGLLDEAPIWSDLATLDAGAWRGAVDLVVAGIPCQAHSVAGKRRGSDDERELWPLARRILREMGPKLFLLENSAGIIAGDQPFLAGLVGDLAEDGWDAEWLCLAAEEVGAPHRRERLFLLAHRNGGGLGVQWIEGGQPQTHGQGEARELCALRGQSDRCDEALERSQHQSAGPESEQQQDGAVESAEPGIRVEADEGLAHGHGHGPQGILASRTAPPPAIGGHPALPYANSERVWVQPERRQQDASQCGNAEPGDDGSRWPLPLFPPGPQDTAGWGQILSLDPSLEPSVRRDAHVLSARVDRLRALGNSVVSLQAAVAFRVLADRLGLVGSEEEDQ